ncbi:hypothetical protein C2G38_2180738 [Gigaspora rosea]|uniref:Uncharacterized protein n=1 Tax=Gigaspora rosea TaxID=44941 RepID=A0A397VCX4_9GLOM|nr:hypothetical protein C2G38_2180738 [Gigaspora rosea]
MESNTNSKASDEPTDHAASTIDISRIDGNTKAYIDAACQNSANMIIASIRALFDQHAATQSATINKLNTCIGQCFERLQTQQSQQQPLKPQENPRHNHDLDITAQQQKTLHQQQDAGHNHTFNATTTQHKEKQTEQGSPSQQGNCPLTHLLNNLILNTATTQTSMDTSRHTIPFRAINMLKTKITTRKYPSFEYSEIDLPPVSSFSNNHAEEVESIRMWWILNWSEGQKALEMLPNKPNLPLRLWKAIAIRNYIDLAEFGYKV